MRESKPVNGIDDHLKERKTKAARLFPLWTGWGKWVFFVSGWVLLSLLFSPEIYLHYLLFRGEPIAWYRAIQLTTANAAIAIIFLPGIVWLSRRYPFERAKWGKALAFHLPACLLFSAAHSGLYWLACYASHEVGTTLLFRFQPNLLTYWAIVGFTQAVDYFQRYTEREKLMAKGKLLLLKAQLHPHFLFNTLNTISAMIHEDAAAADKTISRLSDLLRMIIDSIGENETALRNELDFLRKYVELQQIRFPDALMLELKVEPAALDAIVPSMLLQPLAENSLRHGLDLPHQSGLIRVSASLEGSRLRITVRDNGRGAPAGWPVRDGTGLSNLRMRLEYLYPGACSFAAANEPDAPGFRVSMEIPYQAETSAGRGIQWEMHADDDSSSDRRR